MAKLTYDERYADLDALFCDDHVCAARAYVRDVFTGGQPETADGVHVWFDGELYNQAEPFGREPARSWFDSLLRIRDALYTSYVPRTFVEPLWDVPLHGRDHSAQLCKLATLEGWLQQLFTGEYRPGSADAQALLGRRA